MTLAAVRHGEGPRPLVLLHGFLGSARNVTTLARRLAASDPALSVVALDLTGHGASPPLPPGADLSTVAEDVLGTVRALGLGTPVTVVGHSLGGRVALRACLLEPAGIASVTLIDISPSPATRGDDVEVVLEALLTAPATGSRRDDFRGHLRARGLPESLVEWLLTNLEEAPGGFRWRIDRGALASFHRRVRGEDLWAAVEGPERCRVRCIRGGDSPYVSDEEARRLEAAGAAVETIEGAGHFVHVDRPDQLLTSLTATR